MQKNPEKNKEILRVVEAAKILNVSHKTLTKWRYQGRGPAFVKEGRYVRYLLEDLYSFMQLNRVSFNNTEISIEPEPEISPSSIGTKDFIDDLLS